HTAAVAAGLSGVARGAAIAAADPVGACLAGPALDVAAATGQRVGDEVGAADTRTTDLVAVTGLGGATLSFADTVAADAELGGPTHPPAEATVVAVAVHKGARSVAAGLTEATADTATDTFTTDTLEAFTTLDTTGAAAELAGLEVDAVVEAATIFGVAAHRVATDPSC